MHTFVEGLVSEIRRLLKVALRRRWLALTVFAIVAVAWAIGVSFWPNRYQATARVYVDTQTVLKPLMASITFQPDIEQQVSMLARTLISRPNVEKLVANPELGLADPDALKREKTVNRLIDNIKIVPAGAGNLYDITYKGPSPQRALQLVSATVDLFVDSGEGAKKRDSKDAGKFIEQQIASYEAKLIESETRLKEFKMRNFGATGVSNQDYFARVSSLTEEVSKLRVDLSGAEQARDSYRKELASEDPQLPAELAGQRVYANPDDIESRLDAQKRALDDLLRKFTDAHPDVINARRVVGELESEVAARRAALASKGVRMGNAATSPVYQRLRISLAEAEAQVASLRSQLGAKQVLLDETRAAAGRLPGVEAELVQLNRDYDIIRKNYDTMVARRESAALGLRLDESSQLAEFRVVEPPRVLPSAVFPSRTQLSVIGLFVALALSLLATLTAEQASPAVDDRATLAKLSGRTVIGAVSLLTTPKLVRQRRAKTLQFASVAALLVVGQVAWVTWLAFSAHPI